MGKTLMSLFLPPWQPKFGKRLPLLSWWGSTFPKTQKPGDIDWDKKKKTVASASPARKVFFQVLPRLLTHVEVLGLPFTEPACLSNLWLQIDISLPKISSQVLGSFWQNSTFNHCPWHCTNIQQSYGGFSSPTISLSNASATTKINLAQYLSFLQFN
jgi:hypothetical protein